MFEPDFVLAARAVFWPLYLAALAVALAASITGRNATLARGALALALGSLAQFALESGGQALSWWQQLAISVAIFAAVTVPPRSYWQSGLAALVGVQILLHAIWGLAAAFALPDLAWTHYALCLYVGFAKVAVLLLWSGGRHVQLVADGVSRRFAHLVLEPLGSKRAG